MAKNLETIQESRDRDLKRAILNKSELENELLNMVVTFAEKHSVNIKVEIKVDTYSNFLDGEKVENGVAKKEVTTQISNNTGTIKN